MTTSYAAAPRRFPVIAVLVSVLLLATSLTPAAIAQTPEATQDPGAAFDIPDTEFVETDECPYFPPPGFTEGEDLVCGTVIVPLDYENSDAGSAELLVIHLASTSDDSAAEPLIVLNGGPGGNLGSHLNLFGSEFPFLRPILERQDVILFDQRGMGASIPSLDCSSARASLGFAACVEEHQEQGIDHAHFTVTSNAADVASLANAFGAEQVDLYGYSFGTFLGEVVLRDHPGVVRSAILFAPTPAETNRFADRYIGFDAALTTLFEQCEADDACSGTVESLDEDLQSVVDQLGTGAGSIEVTAVDPNTGQRDDILVTDVMFMLMLFNLLASTEAAPLVAPLIGETSDGETALLEEIFSFGPMSDPTQQEGFSQGAHYTNICQDRVPFTNYVETQGIIAEAEVRPAVSQIYDAGLNYTSALCNAGELEPSDRINNEPVISDIPSLILNGELDPLVPPANGEILTANLENSYLVNLPGVGHSWPFDGEPCMTSIMGQFLHDPIAELDTSCTADMEVDFSGPSMILPSGEMEATPDTVTPAD